MDQTACRAPLEPWPHRRAVLRMERSQAPRSGWRPRYVRWSTVRAFY